MKLTRMFAIGAFWLLPMSALAQELPEVQKLKAENHMLKVQVVQLQKQLAEVQLQSLASEVSKERVALEAEFRLALKPAEGSVFDWNKLAFAPPEKK